MNDIMLADYDVKEMELQDMINTDGGRSTRSCGLLSAIFGAARGTINLVESTIYGSLGIVGNFLSTLFCY